MHAEIVVAGIDSLAATCAAHFVQRGVEAIERRGRFACALSGGSVATAFFPRLAAARVDWTRVDFFWADERCVPAENPESNFGLARRLWFEPAAVPPARLHSMAGIRSDPQAGAAAIEAELVRTLGNPPCLDVVLLGVGPDGHVASLFPGHPVLGEREHWVAAVEAAPKPPPQRLTLTLPALGAAREIWVAAFGAAKAAVVHEAFVDPASRLPLALVVRSGPPVRWLLDPGAASRLGDISPA